jgi:DNA segregation ATPase FtsK/SpoIIIE-like protein
MTSENHHPGYVLIPTQKFEQLVALASTSEPLTVPEGNSSRDLAQSARGAHAMGEARHADETDWPLPAGVPTYEDALKLVLHFRKPSVSFIQRKLQIGYNKACDYIEIMEAKGIVSRSNSAGVRTMLAPAIRREDESHG